MACFHCEMAPLPPCRRCHERLGTPVPPPNAFADKMNYMNVELAITREEYWAQPVGRAPVHPHYKARVNPGEWWD